MITTQQTFALMKTSFIIVFRRRLQVVLIKTNIYSPYSYVFRRRLQDVFKTFSRRLQDIDVFLQKHLQDIFKTSCQDVLPRRLQEVFKTSSRRLAKKSSRHLAKTSSRCFEDVFKTSSPYRWKEKHCSLFQIIWSFPFSEEVLHKYGVSGYSTFVNFC